MNALFPQRMTKAEFFRWVQGREGRYELSEGRVMQQMTGGTVRHFDLADQIRDAIKSRIDQAVWVATVGGPGIAISAAVAKATTRYPDVVVRRSGTAPTAIEIDAPALIVEVLSPSSVTMDLVIKPREYLPITSLEAYIVASQDERRLTIWQRDATRAFPPLPVELTDGADQIRIDSLGMTVTLAELYGGVLAV